jgi:hypothetical protein
MELPDKIERKWIGTRVGFVLVSVLCYFGTLYVITSFGTQLPSPEMVAAGALDPIVALDQDQTWTALEWLLGVLGVAIAGDTARPSGMKGAAFGAGSNGAGAPAV